MKKLLLSATAILMSVYCLAQEQLAFPFQGGKDVMTTFFKENVIASPQIIQKKATGVAIVKFTADQKGAISKIIVYYADDSTLVVPVIVALKKSNRKWIIPNHERLHDFIIPFTFSFNPPSVVDEDLQKAIYNNSQNHHPIVSTDQVPLDECTLLPAMTIKYDIEQ